MSGFVANSPATTETVITNAVFWPDIDPVTCRSVMRLDQSVTPDRLRHALISAMGEINADLKAWAAEQQLAGSATLAEVPGDQIDGQPVPVSLYTRAVYCFAKAELIERYQDYDSTLSGSRRADDLGRSVDDYRRQGITAIRRLIGVAQTTVELI